MENEINIFFLHNNPHLAASYHCDKHVVKMIVECAQMLSTAHHMLYQHGPYHDSVGFYKPTHVNHPCNIWVRESRQNYIWLYELFSNLLDEHYDRYTRNHGKYHKCWNMVDLLAGVPTSMKDRGITPIPLCMPEEYHDPNPIVAYRKFYIGEKSRFAKWKTGEVPRWFAEKDVSLNPKLEGSVN